MRNAALNKMDLGQNFLSQRTVGDSGTRYEDVEKTFQLVSEDGVL